MSKQWFIQGKVLCSPEQNLSNTTGSPSCHSFARSQKTSSNLAAHLSSESRLDHLKKCFPNKATSWAISASARKWQRGSTHFIFHGEEAIAPDPLKRKGLDDRPLLHDEHVKDLQVACKANTAMFPHKSWHFSSPWVFGIHRESELFHLCPTENLFKWKIFFAQMAILEAPLHPEICPFFSGYPTSPWKLHYKLINN